MVVGAFPGLAWSAPALPRHFPRRCCFSVWHSTSSSIDGFDAIVSLAKGLKLDLIAEGVETDPQLEYLRDLGCESIQGYLFGKAEGAERTTEILYCVEQGDLIRNLATV